MTIEKASVVGQLQESSLLLPDRVAAGLAANGRIKFALSWLQVAEVSPASVSDLEPERALVGLIHDSLYAPPEGIKADGGGLLVPRAGEVVKRLLADLAAMREAVQAGADAGLFDSGRPREFRQREISVAAAARLEGDLLKPGYVSTLSRPGPDSLHGLVMDMHKALDAIASQLSEETVAGARAWRLDANDKARLSAFMGGLGRTASLKFGHPGLATNAMRDGERLIIENDIGATDAHVVIAHVDGLKLSLTYSDIHKPRLDFFQRRLPDFAWTLSSQAAAHLEKDMFYLATGELNTSDTAALDAALEKLGSNLVFLIDWNKARKSLRHFVSKKEVIAILDWAADSQVGHRGYLEMGGDSMIADLLETATRATGGFYPTLQSALGEGAGEFLRETLRISSEGLRAERSMMAIRELLRAELLTRLASASDRILDAALDHAALVLDLGQLAHAALMDPNAAGGFVMRAQEWERLADAQVKRIRDLCGSGNQKIWRVIASSADDAADDFEETAFRLQFLPANTPSEVRAGLLDLAGHAVGAAKQYVRLLYALKRMREFGARQDMRDFLDLVERLHEEEHATDRAERALFKSLITANGVSLVNVASAVAGSLEKVGDALLHAAREISDYALGEWFAY